MKKLLLGMLTIVCARIHAIDNPPSKDLEIINQLLSKHYPHAQRGDFFKIDSSTGTMTRLSQEELNGKYITLEKINIKDRHPGYSKNALVAGIGGGVVVGALAAIGLRALIN